MDHYNSRGETRRTYASEAILQNRVCAHRSACGRRCSIVHAGAASRRHGWFGVCTRARVSATRGATVSEVDEPL